MISRHALGPTLATALMIAQSGQAQSAAPPPGLPGCPPDPETARLKSDWANLEQYHAANGARTLAREDARRVVFIGDSITVKWFNDDPAWRATSNFVGRGISGQTAPQMLVRFRDDVLALHPRVVHIMAGTNDIAGNTGPESLEAVEGYIASMAQLAEANHIRVVIASVPPAADFPWRKGLDPAPKIVALNRWLEAFARQEHLIYADYYGVLSDGAGAMKPEFSADGVHPNLAAYGRIEPLAKAAIAEALEQ